MRLAFQAAIAVILAAARAGYTLTPVTVHGKPAVSVDVISAAGTIGGTYKNAAGIHLGYLLSGSVLTTLKPDPYRTLPFDSPRPTGINDKGVVAGLAMGIGVNGSNSIGFLWKDGHYINKKNGIVSFGQDYQTVVSINRSNTVAFNTTAQDNTAYYGKKYPFQAIPIFYGNFPFVDNINRAGVTAGYYQNYPLKSIFTCTSAGVITTIQGPGNATAFDGFINDSGAVAGVYGYGQSSPPFAGFVLKNGKYKTFDIPVTSKTMDVAGFNNSGYVVGTYTDAAGAFHGFAWNGKTFSELVPNPSATETVTVVGVSDAGDVALDLTNTTNGANVPYVAHCQGNGC